MSSETPLYTIRIADNNYTLNFSGDQIAEAIRKMLEFNPDVIGTTHIPSTSELPCDLDLLRNIGDYFIDYVKNGPTETKDVVGNRLCVCEIDGTLHQILYINDKIYVRKFDKDTNKFNSEWVQYGFGTTVYDGNVPPIETVVGTLWVDTSGKLPQLKRWNGKEWVQFSPVGPGEMSEFIHNTVLLTSDVAIIPTGIKAYDKSKGHMLMAFINSTLLVESTDFEILNDGLHIRKINDTWVGTPQKPITFDFFLFIPGIAVAGEYGSSEELEEEVASLKKRIELLQIYLGNLQDKLDDAIEGSDTTIGDLQDKVATITEEIDRLKSVIKELQTSNISQDSLIDQLKKNQELMQNQINELKKIIEEGGGVIGQLPENVVYWQAIDDSTEEVSMKAASKVATRAVGNSLPDNLVYYLTEDGEVGIL